MSPQFDLLTTQAPERPPEQRAELAHLLWASVDGLVDHDDEELFTEIGRRDTEVESGKVQPLSHEQVMRNLRQVLGE